MALVILKAGSHPAGSPALDALQLPIFCCFRRLLPGTLHSVTKDGFKKAQKLPKTVLAIPVVHEVVHRISGDYKTVGMVLRQGGRQLDLIALFPPVPQ